MYDDWVDETLTVLRKKCKECSPTMNNNVVTSLFKLLNCFFSEFIATEIKKVEPEDIDHLASVLQPLFIFCLIWSLCCTINTEGRVIMNDYVRKKLLELNLIKVDIPEEGTIYDYKFKHRDNDWELWTEASS
jgi:dynein heavy chain